MDWDAEFDDDESHTVTRRYFFCWKDETELPDTRDLTNTQVC